MLCGEPTVDLTMLKRRVVYAGFNVLSKEVVWLWDVLGRFSQVRTTCTFSLMGMSEKFTLQAGQLHIAEHSCGYMYIVCSTFHGSICRI